MFLGILSYSYRLKGCIGVKNYFDLTGKIAFLTGGSSGLGVQMAKALANQGATVVVAARREEKLKQTVKELEAMGAEASYTVIDVLKPETIDQAVKEILDRYGRIDILVNDAGVGRSVPAEEQSIETWRQIVGTNLDGLYYVARAVGRVMIKQGYGKIINMGSIHSEVGMLASSGLSAYAAAKGGVKMLTKQLATEWAKYGITVNAIGPAYFRSEMTEDAVGNEAFQQALKAYSPMGRLGKPGELDGAVIYFASDASSFTTGQILYVDGGWTAI